MIPTLAYVTGLAATLTAGLTLFIRNERGTQVRKLAWLMIAAAPLWPLALVGALVFYAWVYLVAGALKTRGAP